MSRRARWRGVVAAAAFAAAIPSGAPLEAQSPGRQVLTAEDIRRYAIGDLSELVLWLDDWDAWSVDGFTWGASPAGLGPPQHAPWEVLIDGEPVEIDLFDVRALGRIPLTPADLDSVEVIARPAFRTAAIADRGIIHLHTRRPGPDRGAHGWLGFGNQTGDPGPFRFTELNSPNVNKEPPDLGVTLTYGGDDLRAALTGVRRRHHAADVENRVRNRAIFGGEFPHMTLLGAMARLDLHPGGIPIRARALHSELEDFFLLGPLGRELPLTERLTRLGASGRVAIGAATRLRYRASYGAQSARPRITAPELDPDWRSATWRAALEAEHRIRAIGLAGAVELVRKTAESRHAAARPGYTLVRVHGRAERRLSDALAGVIGFATTAAGGGVAFDGLALASWRPAPRHELEASVAWTERRPEEDDRLWSWAERGYTYADHLAIDATVAGDLRRSRTLTADAGWRFRASPSATVRAHAYARSFAELALEDRRFEYRPNAQLFAGPVTLETDAGGEVVGASIGLTATPARAIAFGLRYRHQQAVAGDPVFRDAWRPVPRHRARLTIDYTPLETLVFRATTHYRSGSRWPAYEGANEASAGRFHERLRERTWIDLSIGKWLWDRRLRGNLLLRNLFDASDVRFHPIGKAYDLGVYLHLEVRLGASRD